MRFNWDLGSGSDLRWDLGFGGCDAGSCDCMLWPEVLVGVH